MPLFQYAATGCMMISDNISPCFPWMSHQTDEDLHGEDADEDVRSPRRGAPFIFFRPIEVPWKSWFDNQWYLKNGISMIMVFWYTMIWWYFTNWYHRSWYFDIHNLMLMIIIFLSKLLSIYICYLNLLVISVHYIYIYIYTVFLINIPIQIKLSKLLSVYIVWHIFIIEIRGISPEMEWPEIDGIRSFNLGRLEWPLIWEAIGHGIYVLGVGHICV